MLESLLYFCSFFFWTIRYTRQLNVFLFFLLFVTLLSSFSFPIFDLWSDKYFFFFLENFTASRFSAFSAQFKFFFLSQNPNEVFKLEWNNKNIRRFFKIVLKRRWVRENWKVLSNVTLLLNSRRKSRNSVTRT